MSKHWLAVVALCLIFSPVQAGKRDWWEALEQGDLPKIEAEIAAGRNPNRAKFNGIVPLTLACATGDLEVVKSLINHGAKPFP